jgi:DNA-binding FadR family transcriptional regulator
VRRVRKAYEQVADQLRELITSGELSPGERLPNEALLAREFGVSRATIREALRVLAAQNLLRTAKGAGGGSYVTIPTVDHISEFLRSNIGLLTDSRDLTLEELIETRELLEVPAARLAARRRSDSDVERLRAAIPAEAIRLDTREEFIHNTEFHTVLIETCGN